MNIDYAVDRLYESGWLPSLGIELCEPLPDGRTFPSVKAIRREFEQAGLQLVINHNAAFSAYRATWSPATDARGTTGVESYALHGTVIGSSECEAAVYALAQLRDSRQTLRPTLMA